MRGWHTNVSLTPKWIKEHLSGEFLVVTPVAPTTSRWKRYMWVRMVQSWSETEQNKLNFFIYMQEKRQRDFLVDLLTHTHKKPNRNRRVEWVNKMCICRHWKLFSHKRRELWHCCNMDGTRGCHVKWKKPVTKGKRCTIPFVWALRIVNFAVRKLAEGAGAGEQWGTQCFRGHHFS
jgi:hypothetical protein